MREGLAKLDLDSMARVEKSKRSMIRFPKKKELEKPQFALNFQKKWRIYTICKDAISPIVTYRPAKIQKI